MPFDRAQPEHPSSERSNNRAAAFYASDRMSNEVHGTVSPAVYRRQDHRQEMDFHPRGVEQERGRIQLERDQRSPQFERDLRGPQLERNRRFSELERERRDVPVDRGQHGRDRDRSHIVGLASESVGQRLWAKTKFARVVQNGNLGCAASVSECLQRAGFAYANDAGVGGLVDRLTRNGWTKHAFHEAKPGDVIYGHKGSGWRNGGGNAHIGIMGENGHAYANSSGNGKWIHAPVERIIGSRFGQNRFCLRAPGGGVRDNFDCAPMPVPPNRRRDDGEIDLPPLTPLKPGQPPERSSTNFDVIMDNRTSAQDKLAAVQALSHQGMSTIRFQGKDGQEYGLRTETQKTGNREMVHLFITLPDGKERVVLRGIAQGNGSFVKEQNNQNQQVEFYGKGAAYLYSESSDDLYRFSGSSKPASSLYEQYRHKQDRREREMPEIFNQQDFRDGSSESLNQIMDEAQSLARGATNQLIKTSRGIYMRARMDIDSDGSPRARQIDPTGQTQTSMRYTDGKSINSEVVPYMVLPGGQYSQFGIKLGDMCLVRNRENGRMAIAVFADVGPRHKRGEGSMALATELGINPSPTRGGTSKPNIEYLVLPGSGSPVQNQDQLLARIKAQRQRVGLN